MRKLIMMLLIVLLPAGVSGQALKVEKPKKYEQPAGTIDRVSKRTQFGKRLDYGQINGDLTALVIGAAPLHYKDGTGAWREYKFDEVDTGVKGKGGLDREINVGPYKFQYSTSRPGKMRYEGSAGYIEFSPAFDSTQVKSKFEVSATMVKATYILDDKSPHRLAWALDATAPLSKILPPVAWTDKGDSVGVEALLKSDSLIYTVFRDEGFKGAIYVDPSIQDTALATPASAAIGGGGGYAVIRDAYVGTTTYQANRWVINNNTEVYNTYFTFDLTTYDVPATVDSARFYRYLATKPGTATWDTTYIIEGTFTGAAATTGWYNDFTGWTADSLAWTVVKYTAPFAANNSSTNGTWDSKLFTSAGLTGIDDAMGRDSLRLVAINASVVNDLGGAVGYDQYWGTTTIEAYLVVYYVTLNPAGVTVGADTTRYLKLDATVDSLGGRNLSLRGFQYCPLDWSDTTSVVETGDFGIGVYSLLTDILAADISVAYRAFVAHVANDTSFSAWDTAAPGGGAVRVDGREVNAFW